MSQHGAMDMSSSYPSSSGNSTPPTSELQQPSPTSAPPSAPSSPKDQGRRVFTRNSLRELMHRHSGLSLFVRPICWTDFHTQLLGVQFTELPPCNTPLPVNEPGSPIRRGHLYPSPTITSLSESLGEILSPTAGHPSQVFTAVRTVLSTLWPAAFYKPKYIPELHIYYGDKVYRDVVRAQLMWNFLDASLGSAQSSFKSVSTYPAGSHSHPSTGPSGHNPAGLPMVCYIGKDHLPSIRRNMFRVASAPGQQWNEPVYRLQQLRARLLMPADINRDAHLAGIFLAMAQRHFYGALAPPLQKVSVWSTLKGKPRCPEFHDITLKILSHDNETAEFIVYTGHVTANFLKRFHYPHKAPAGKAGSGVEGLQIDYTRVPIWPILGLRERLGKALGEEVVGHFDATRMVTWESEVNEPALAAQGKRKREALSEVLNGSFDEESDDEQPVTMNGKKRCLREGPPMGLVI